MRQPGVYQTTRKDNSIYYRASITFRGRHISLGSYDAQEDAGNAYQTAQDILVNNCYEICDFARCSSLPLDKFVILVNFRDSGIYFKTPIYLYPHHFEYYLSKDCVLLFDRDDLFFYAGHKIMQRGNRLFYCDYGSQYGLLLRYGLKSYAVAGRDYRFVNGNAHDLRYANIQAINIYTGVQKCLTDTTPRYKVSIHVNGNYQVGIYNDEETAAIAYNKAADILNQNGIPKRYIRNYITSLSEQDYKTRYREIEVSKRLYSVKPVNP